MSEQAPTERPKGRHGGRRVGAGRPRGSRNVLPKGEAKALKSLRWRVPPEAPPEAVELADRALQRIVDVMEEGVEVSAAGNVLRAAVRIREEICRPLAQKLEHSGPASEPLSIIIRKETA